MTDNTGRDYASAAESHIIREVRLPPGIIEDAPGLSPKRSSLPLPRNAFEVAPLLSKAECNGLVKLADEGGFTSVSWEYDPVHKSHSQ